MTILDLEHVDSIVHRQGMVLNRRLLSKILGLDVAHEIVHQLGACIGLRQPRKGVGCLLCKMEAKSRPS